MCSISRLPSLPSGALLIEVFHPVRKKWKFPKCHTLTSFGSPVRDRGVGRTNREVASHRSKKELLRFTSRVGSTFVHFSRITHHEDLTLLHASKESGIPQPLKAVQVLEDRKSVV